MVLAILQARTSSTRLPRKVLLPVLGEPMLARQVERVLCARRLDRVVLATSDHPDDDPLDALARRIGIDCHRGSLDDVLDRFHGAAMPYGPEHVVRLTGDCPLADPAVIDACIDLHLREGFDYTSNCLPATFPDGLDVEVMRASALDAAWKEADRPVEREHVTYFIHQRPRRFRLGNLSNETDESALRWTVDEPEDHAFVTAVFEALYPTDPAFDRHAVMRLLAARPELSRINRDHVRNAGLQASLAADARSRTDA